MDTIDAVRAGRQHHSMANYAQMYHARAARFSRHPCVHPHARRPARPADACVPERRPAHVRLMLGCLWKTGSLPGTHSGAPQQARLARTELPAPRRPGRAWARQPHPHGALRRRLRDVARHAVRRQPHGPAGRLAVPLPQHIAGRVHELFAGAGRAARDPVQWRIVAVAAPCGRPRRCPLR